MASSLSLSLSIKAFPSSDLNFPDPDVIIAISILSALPSHNSTKEINNFFDSNNEKLVDNEKSLAIRSNWVSSMDDFVWKKQNTLIARSLVFPMKSFKATVFLTVYVDKALASCAIEVI